MFGKATTKEPTTPLDEHGGQQFRSAYNEPRNGYWDTCYIDSTDQGSWTPDFLPRPHYERPYRYRGTMVIEPNPRVLNSVVNL